MAGVKGRSGGAREGAGRPPAPPRQNKSKSLQTTDEDDFLRAVMSDPKADMKDRMAAALALKKGGTSTREPGKKQASQDAAEALVKQSRSLAPDPPPGRPMLRAVK